MWTFRQENFNADEIALNGNRFMLGNGYMGFRGTLEEYGREHYVACMLNGVYDRVGDQWREPVNAPNGMLVQVLCNGEMLSPLTSKVLNHVQELDIRHGIHHRRTVFEKDGGEITVKAERFISHDRVHLMAMKYSVSASVPVKLVIRSGIDGAVWDINGPHLQQLELTGEDNLLQAKAVTGELKHEIITSALNGFQGVNCGTAEAVWMEKELVLAAGQEWSFCKYVSVCTSQDGAGASAMAVLECQQAAQIGYDELLKHHAAKCEDFWRKSDVVISGDDEAQFALRYSLYHLMILATRHSSAVSIPARGLSGQVYKGAVFWDTEMFMLPFFTLTDPAVARNLILFRYRTLDGARRKAREYGFDGAFFAWESQETGDDACSHFNVPDVFSGRPMRTYFRDKQVHISADVAFAIKQYLRQTGDVAILREGAAEVIIECARFFYSYAYYKPGKARYEVLDVTGPDEYHERVNNNAYTNKMVYETMNIALEALDTLRLKDRAGYDELAHRLNFEGELEAWRMMKDQLYVPAPAADTLLIEQFDRYFTLEDISMETLKSRKLHPDEYLGGGNGLAASTQILKQADVVLMLNLFKHEYGSEVIRRNWEYYEPRTEHGSSLSACAYAMTAAHIGKPDWAYKFFMKTATVDMTGHSKQFIGSLYIGGTHPAANGGAWLAAIFGFAGVSIVEEAVIINPSLPEKWQSISFPLVLRGQEYFVTAGREKVEVRSADGNEAPQLFRCGEVSVNVQPGKTAVWHNKTAVK